MGKHRKPSDPSWWPLAAVLAVLTSATIATVLGVSIAWWVYAATH